MFQVHDIFQEIFFKILFLLVSWSLLITGIKSYHLNFVIKLILRKSKQRTFLWCLGIIIFEMLAGHPPFDGEDEEELYASITEHTANFPKYFSKDATSILKGVINLYVFVVLTWKKTDNFNFLASSKKSGKETWKWSTRTNGHSGSCVFSQDHLGKVADEGNSTTVRTKNC